MPERLHAWLAGPMGWAIALSLALHLALVALIRPAPPRAGEATVVLNARIVARMDAPPAPMAPVELSADAPGEPIQDLHVAAQPVAQPPLAPSPPASSAEQPPPMGERRDPPAQSAPGSASRAAPDEPAPLAAQVPLLADPTWYSAREVDQHPRALRAIQPAYPVRARREGVEGTVVIQLKIDESGVVRDAQVVESDPPGVFDQAVMEAFSPARFAPARRNGAPVRALVRIRVRFEMDGEG